MGRLGTGERSLRLRVLGIMNLGFGVSGFLGCLGFFGFRALRVRVLGLRELVAWGNTGLGFRIWGGCRVCLDLWGLGFRV